MGRAGHLVLSTLPPSLQISSTSQESRFHLDNESWLAAGVIFNFRWAAYLHVVTAPSEGTIPFQQHEPTCGRKAHYCLYSKCVCDVCTHTPVLFCSPRVGKVHSPTLSPNVGRKTRVAAVVHPAWMHTNVRTDPSPLFPALRKRPTCIAH